MLTATTAAIATYNGGYPDAKNWLTTALIAKWGVDQMTKSGVSVNLARTPCNLSSSPMAFSRPGQLHRHPHAEQLHLPSGDAARQHV